MAEGCSECEARLAAKVAQFPRKPTQDVHFSLPPFEAGMLMGVIAQQLERVSMFDAPNDPFRRAALKRCWATLSNDMRDWQEAQRE